MAGGTVNLFADGQNPDGEDRVPLRYRWFAPTGIFQNPDDRQTTWTAPQQEGAVPVTITVDDGRGGLASDTLAIQVIAPLGPPPTVGSRGGKPPAAAKSAPTPAATATPEISSPVPVPTIPTAPVAGAPIVLTGTLTGHDLLFPMSVYIGVACFGGILILLAVAAALFAHGPLDEFRRDVVRTALALGCGCVSILFPGVMDAKLPDSFVARAGINVTGPLTIFAFVFIMLRPKDPPSSTNSQSTPPARDPPA